jgi:hypothetical protein
LSGFCDWIIFDLIMALCFFSLYRIYSEHYSNFLISEAVLRGYSSHLVIALGISHIYHNIHRMWNIRLKSSTKYTNVLDGISKQTCYIMKISLAVSYLNPNIMFVQNTASFFNNILLFVLFISIENLIELTLVLYSLVMHFLLSVSLNDN